MDEDLATNLSNYKAQLQQVEATLTTDPSNEDLLKLQKDLLEVIELTEDLIQSQTLASAQQDEAGASSMVAATSSAITSWAVGARCSAVWSKDQQYYPATIDEIQMDGTCTVTFEDYGNTEVMQVSVLRPLDVSLKRVAQQNDGAKKPTTKKDRIAAEREYKKKKAQKKAQRLKALEEEREQEKCKWQTFNSKIFSKTTKGKVKKSIFASPDHVDGRVGVGTCGLSGKPMTKFVHRDKWKK